MSTNPPPPTPQQRKQMLKDRLQAVKKLLPASWAPVFIHVYTEYKDSMTLLQNVNKGKSLDETVIEKMEALAQALSPKS